LVATDVTGFTPLSERLARRGRIGAEVLGETIDQCFSGLIEALTPWGGDVLTFGGDALLVAFLGEEHAGRAVDSGIAMMRALRQMVPLTTPLGPVRLTMSVGVATGSIDLVVGDGPQRPLLVGGPTTSRAIELEARADPGQLFIDRTTADRIPAADRRAVDRESWIVTRRRSRRATVATAIVDAPLPRTGQPELHVPQALRAGLLRGDAPKEHRHVAVAFVRMTDLDRLDPDGRAGLLSRLSVVVGQACESFDVAWIETDAVPGGAKILIAAGIPHQHDDDELRVVAAARRIADSDIGDRLSIGIDRGNAFVGDIGHVRRRTYTVMGLTTVTASRLTTAAGRGAVLAGAAIVERLGRRYECGPVTELVVKGRRDPVPAHAIGRLVAIHAGRVLSPLVGRRRELTVLAQALSAHHAGVGTIVEVVGPPGMGKSHLVSAFLATAPPARVSVAGELALDGVPFAVVARSLRTTLASGERPLSSALAPAGDLAPLLGPVLDLDLPPTEASRAIEPGAIAAVRAELVAQLLRDPAGLMVLEDVHWLDPASRELLAAIARPLADSGWLVVVVRRPDTPAITTEALSIALDPLPDDDVERIVAASVDRPLSDARINAIIRHAGGNALFAAQLARSARTPDEIGLSESAERVIGARIDLLAPELRSRLRRASVLGARVDLDVLGEVLAEAELATAAAWHGLEEFVECSPTVLEFRHDLFRLAAYEGLSFADRALLHRAAADVLEHRPGTPPAVLAEHALYAGRPREVVRWATLAADEAAASAAFVDETRMRRLAAESARAAGVEREDRARLYEALAASYETMAEFDLAETACQRALRLAAPPRRAEVRVRLAWLALRRDDIPRARRRVAAALRQPSPAGADRDVLRAELIVLRAGIRGQLGDLRRSDEDARWVEAEARRLGHERLLGEALMQQAMNADQAEDPHAEVLLADAIPLLQRAGLHREIAILEMNRGVTHMVHGRWPAALSSFDAAAAGFRRCGFVLGSIVTDLNRGGLVLEMGEPYAAAELFDSTVRRARAAGREATALFASGSAHRARAWTGETEKAISGIESCLVRANRSEHRSETDDLEAYLVEVLVLAGRFDEARIRAAALLERLVDRSSEVVVLTTKRLAAVAAHFAGEPGGLDDVTSALEAARAAQCGIEIARGLQALQACAPEIDERWESEQEVWCSMLGVTWMPPVTFAAPSR
jgi:class 3 adenylate cyclase/tetratricopeptide (TPR) repeat protein